MATLIGAGSHARDILISGVIPIEQQFAHHSVFPSSHVANVVIGINDPWVRAAVADEIDRVDLNWEHPTATITDSRWGWGTHINAGSIVIRARIGTYVTISPGVTICGDVRIGDRCLIGANATICDRVTIGDDVTIGAGCVVLPESVVDNGSTIVGVPAKHLATGVHVK